MNTVIETQGLCFAYGRHHVLRDVKLTVASGNFYALLGRNGAGKTTLLKILAGLLLAQKGSSTTLGRDSAQLTLLDWTTIGYVSESQPIYDWYTGAELIAFTRALYPNWDDAFCQHLLKRLRLPLERPVRNYSKGERMKIVLLLAMAFHPRLLVLDEPFSGLDVLVKEQLITCLLEATGQEQWSVIFASHDLLEVERLADVIGLIDDGRLTLSEPLDSLQARFRKVEVFSPTAPPEIDPTMLQPVRDNGKFSFIETAFTPQRESELHQRYGTSLEITPLSLREIVLALFASEPEQP
jgi:ABC-2 type transport system ATP-binding protein